MSGGTRTAAAFLIVAAAAGLGAPWLGLRDPAAQPDTLVLRDLPPLSRPHAIRLRDGSLRYAEEVRPLGDGGAAYRRGGRWSDLGAAELAGSEERVWHVRPLYVLGTDGFGRDLLSRLVHGGRISLLVGLAGAALALGLGAGLGLVSGLCGGWIDSALMRFTDVVLAVPRLFLALLLVALYGPSLATTIVVLGSTTWMSAARLVRAEVLSLRERDYVLAARASGAAPWRLGLRHLLPAAAVPAVVEGALRVGDTILLEAALSFLELGVRPPTPSWGNLIADGRHAMLDAWWVATLPGIAIACTVLAIHTLGEAARERLAAAPSRPRRRPTGRVGVESAREARPLAVGSYAD